MHIGTRRFPVLRTTPLNRYEEGSTLAGVIYLHRVPGDQSGGISGRNFSLFRKLCGESTLKNVVLVTNMWGVDSQGTDEAHEEGLSNKLFKPALDKGAQMVRHHNTTESAHDIIRMLMGSRPAVSQIQRELMDERKDITDAPVGDSINPELKEQVRRHRAGLKEFREEIVLGMDQKDEERRQELEEGSRKMRERMGKITLDEEWLEAGMKVTEQGGKEREQGDVEHERQSTDLTRRLQDGTDASATDRAKLKQPIKRPQDLAGIKIPPDELAHHDTPPRTSETERADLQLQLPMTPSHTPSPQASSLVTPYVQAPFRLATHDS